MKKHILQENYERMFGSIKEGWWDKLKDAAKKSYIKKHGSAPGSTGDDEPKVPAPDSKSDTGKPRVSANPYDDNYGQEVDDEDDYDMGAPDRVPNQDFRSDPTDDDYSVYDDPEIARISDEDDEDDNAEQLKKLDQEIQALDDAKWKAADSGDGVAVRNWGEKLQKAKAKREKMSRTGNELNQETLTIDGKQFRRISESVKKQPKPKYEFSKFYKRFKK